MWICFIFVLNIFLSVLSSHIEKWSIGQRTNRSLTVRRGQGKGSFTNYSLGPLARWGCGVRWEWSEPHRYRVTSELQSTCEFASARRKENKTWPVIVIAQILSEVTEDFCVQTLNIPALADLLMELTNSCPKIRSRVQSVPRMDLSDHSMCRLPIAQGHKGLWVTFVKHQQGL